MSNCPNCDLTFGSCTCTDAQIIMAYKKQKSPTRKYNKPLKERLEDI